MSHDNTPDKMTCNGIYLAGPITGHDLAERRETFAKTAAWLRKTYGTWVYDPCANMQPDGFRIPNEVWLETTLPVIKHVSHVFLMEGYESSKGCAAELEEAFRQKKIVVDLGRLLSSKGIKL